jgi:IMP dehydrogenase
MKTALSFDDVLLVPQYSSIASRKDVDTTTKLSKHITLKIPIISSCMDTITGVDMAIAMWHAGGLGILHRYNTIPEQIDMFLKVRNGKLKNEEIVLFHRTPYANCAVAIGATGDYLERAETLVMAGVDILCVDVAHGDSVLVETAIKSLRHICPDITIIAGNVATGEGCARLIDAGADSVRVGIGSGSLCSTRLMTGNGLPTLHSLFDCQDYLIYRGYKDFSILADGGIKNSGDIVKSIAAGANAVILGQLLGATDESPGELIDMPAGKMKKYRGMSSFGAQADWRPEKQNEIVPEGEDTLLPYKGSVSKVLYQLVGGLRSGMSYSNARTLSELKENAEFIQITGAGWAESKPHAKKDD